MNNYKMYQYDVCSFGYHVCFVIHGESEEEMLKLARANATEAAYCFNEPVFTNLGKLFFLHVISHDLKALINDDSDGLLLSHAMGDLLREVGITVKRYAIEPRSATKEVDHE